MASMLTESHLVKELLRLKRMRDDLLEETEELPVLQERIATLRAEIEQATAESVRTSVELGRARAVLSSQHDKKAGGGLSSPSADAPSAAAATRAALDAAAAERAMDAAALRRALEIKARLAATALGGGLGGGKELRSSLVRQFLRDSSVRLEVLKDGIRALETPRALHAEVRALLLENAELRQRINVMTEGMLASAFQAQDRDLRARRSGRPAAA